MFAGFTSRWTIPTRCAAASASHTGTMIRTVRASGTLRPSVSSWSSEYPDEQLHHEVGDAAGGDAEIHHLHRVGMLDPAGGDAFPAEAGQGIGAGGGAGLQDLDRDRVPELGVFGAEDRAEGAGPDARLQQIAAGQHVPGWTSAGDRASSALATSGAAWRMRSWARTRASTTGRSMGLVT